MDDIARAKKIGYRQAFKAITAGLVVAYLLMASINWDILWLFSFKYLLTILFGIGVIYAAGFFFGGLAGKSILIKRNHPLLVGIIYGFLIVWTSIFIASLLVFFGDSWSTTNSINDRVLDYIFKPLMVVSMFGFLPILFVGIWFGNSIKSQSETKD